MCCLSSGPWSTTSSGASDRRGVGGKLFVADHSERLHPLAKVFLKAAREVGLPANPDLNGPAQEGAGPFQTTIKDGRRMSAARAFLRPAMARENLRVETGAHVTRVLFEGRRAVGVAYVKNGIAREAHAGREVILAGGTVNTPQLLELSGIGDPDVLGRHGIAVVQANRHVGEHLQDHLGLNYTYRSRVPTLNGELRPWWGKLKAGMAYVFFRRGPLSLSLNQAGGFFRTRPDVAEPDMQLYFQAISTLTAKKGTRPLMDPDPFEAFNLGLSSCRPTSRGSIHIASADPSAAPMIRPNAYGTAHDVEEMLAAVKFLRRLAGTPSMAAVIEEELAPGPKVTSDADLIADFRARSGTVYHPVGTARMGPDAGSNVVDPKLRVHGVSGLRVVDGSIMPAIITGNTNAPIMMIGWKGADFVLEQ